MVSAEESYRLFTSGNKSAFGDIVVLYKDNLIFFIQRFVRNYSIAEDLAADAFAYLLMHPGKYNYSVSLKTYLFTIGRSLALNYLRREKRHGTLPIDEKDGAQSDSEELLDSLLADERRRIVNEAIGRLSGDYRTAIHLVFFENMTYDEAARVMKKNKKQIDNLIYRAKKALKEDIGEKGGII